MAKFSKKSLAVLQTCDNSLQEICFEAIKILDFSVISGHRGEDEQAQLLKQGKTKAKYMESKHNYSPSLAVDIAPYPVDWNDKERFYILAGIMIAIAHSKGVKLRWGGDWNMNWNLKDNKFNDLGHFEILK